MSLPTLLALHGGVQGNETAAAIWHQLNPLGGSWLPEHVTVRARKQGKGKARVLSDLVVSERWQGEGEEALWVATGDGRGVRAVDGEEAADDAGGGEGERVERAYELMAVVSFVARGGRTAGDSEGA